MPFIFNQKIMFYIKQNELALQQIYPILMMPDAEFTIFLPVLTFVFISSEL